MLKKEKNTFNWGLKDFFKLFKIKNENNYLVYLEQLNCSIEKIKTMAAIAVDIERFGPLKNLKLAGIFSWLLAGRPTHQLRGLHHHPHCRLAGAAVAAAA